MTTHERIKAYEERLTKWFQARKENVIDLGPEPNPRDFQVDPWVAGQIRKRLEKQFFPC